MTAAHALAWRDLSAKVVSARRSRWLQAQRKTTALLFAPGVGHGRDAGLGGQVLVGVEALAHAARLGRDQCGADASGTGAAHEDAAVFAGGDVVLDAAGQQPDLLDEGGERARQQSRVSARGRR